MLGKAASLGCKDTTDVVCLCSNAAFGNGIRDCTNESCPADAQKSSVISAGQSICSSMSTVEFATQNLHASRCARSRVHNLFSRLNRDRFFCFQRWKRHDQICDCNYPVWNQHRLGCYWNKFRWQQHHLNCR